MDDQYYLFIDGKQKGPYTLGQLRSMWQSGAITANTFYWKEGFPDWHTLTSLGPQLEHTVEQSPVAPPSGPTSFRVIFTSAGANKIAVIKELRQINPTLGLAVAKSLAENPPQTVLDGITRERAEGISRRLSATGSRAQVDSSSLPLRVDQSLATSPATPAQLPIVALFFLFIFGIAALGIYLTFFGGSSGSSTSSSPSYSFSSAPAAESPSDVSWDTIDDIYSLKSKYTDLQKDQEWTRYEGKRVKWSGRVSSISQSFGSLTMQVKMNPGTFTSDVIVTLKDSEKSRAGKLREGDTVTFIATLNRWGTLMPISLSNGEIVE
jgi:ribosomal protein L7/L12